MSDDLLNEPLTITNGTIHVRDAPGVGADIDPERLERYRQDR
jgi:L-alanine-DL-glutamate epimerase-like enolase superfamily enzyme